MTRFAGDARAMRTFPLVALSVLAIAFPIASASWGSLSFTAGDQACLVPPSVYESCLHWGLSGYIRANACDIANATSACHFSFHVVAATSSQDPLPRTVTLTRDNVTACEAYGISNWVSCSVTDNFDRTMAPGACDNTEFHVTGTYGVPPATRRVGTFDASPYQRPDYATLVFCRDLATGDVNDVHLVRDSTLPPGNLP